MTVKIFFKIVGKKFVPMEENDGNDTLAVVEIDNEDTLSFGREVPAEMGEFVIAKAGSLKIDDHVMAIGGGNNYFRVSSQKEDIPEEEFISEEFEEQAEAIAAEMGIAHEVYQGGRSRRY